MEIEIRRKGIIKLTDIIGLYLSVMELVLMMMMTVVKLMMLMMMMMLKFLGWPETVVLVVLVPNSHVSLFN